MRYLFVAAVALGLAGCPFDNVEEVGEASDAGQDLDGAAHGEGEGEGDRRDCEDGARQRCRDGCTVGHQVCREGAWGECRGDINCENERCAAAHPDACQVAPADCEGGAVRECRDGCVVGEQACHEGAWGECRGRVDCDDRECAASHADDCGMRACEDGARQRCREGCIVGGQVCEGGHWGMCRGDVNCDDAECAAGHPDACGEGPGCERGERECREGCVVGRQLCREGAWGECHGEVDCRDAECAHAHPDACREQGDCAPGAHRECRRGCVVGQQECREGGEWTECRGEVDCHQEACAREHPDACRVPDCEAGDRRDCRNQCVRGAQACHEGEWTECSGEVNCGAELCRREYPRVCGEPECEDGAEERCETDCTVGRRGCRDGVWGACHGEVRCEREACARAFPDACHPPECEGDARRECETDCVVGVQACDGGAWGRCVGDVRCAREVCAREFPDHCGGGGECRHGDRQECDTDCVVGVQECDGGEWSRCVGDVRCERAACARAFPDACPQAECEGDARRRCETDCVVGAQGCHEGQWGRCVGEVRCEREVCAREFPDACHQPECRDGMERRCETECVVGGQVCHGGEWGACRGDVRCEREGCAREFPDACPQAECEGDARRRCETDCVVGAQSCREGHWGHCEGEVRCERAACAAEFPNACPQAECEGDQRRECRTDCVPAGVQACREGRWSDCDGAINCDIAACREHFPRACL